MAKETFYFSHDYNARSDEKIKKLLMKHGFAGYGLFWAIVEDLYQNANALQTDYDLLAFEYRTQPGTIKSIVNDFDLFVVKGENFGSMSVQNRLDARDEKSQKARESAKARWEKPEEDANALPPQTDSNAIKESKGKEIKVNNNPIDDFQKFWDRYDKKTDSHKCKLKWKKLSAKEKEMIFKTLPLYISSTPDKTFRKNPLTYLNSRTWEDEITQPGNFSGQPSTSEAPPASITDKYKN